MIEFGYVEGEPCNRNGCAGFIKEHAVENCSCHTHLPCSACTKPRGYCVECGWEESEDFEMNGFVCHENKTTGVWSYEPRKLDPSKIDWHSYGHSNSSMIKEGIYPEGVTQCDVEQEVRGTFGGRFEYFGGGKFKYIAYTD